MSHTSQNRACVGHLSFAAYGYRFSGFPQPHWQLRSRQWQAFFWQPQEQVPQSQVPQQLAFVFGVAFVSDMVVLLEFDLALHALAQGLTYVGRKPYSRGGGVVVWPGEHANEAG